MMNRRTAKTRHNRRANPHGLPASALIAAHLPLPAVVSDATAPLLLPGLLPAIAR